jgi:hypothetical protein
MELKKVAENVAGENRTSIIKKDDVEAATAEVKPKQKAPKPPKAKNMEMKTWMYTHLQSKKLLDTRRCHTDIDRAMVELLPDQQLHFENGLFFIRYMNKIRKKLVSIPSGSYLPLFRKRKGS